jgi:hypothetical protein
MQNRFSQLNKFIVFSFIFSDVMESIIEHYEAHESKYSAALIKHGKEDLHHFRMLISDYKLRMNISNITLEEVETVLFRKEHRFMRTYGYQIMALCQSVLNQPIVLIALLEAIEGTSKAMLVGYNEALRQYEQFSGLNLAYFGDAHINIEQGHENLFDVVDEFNAQDFAQAQSIIKAHFANARVMLDKSLTCTYEYEDAVLAQIKQ